MTASVDAWREFERRTEAGFQTLSAMRHAKPPGRRRHGGLLHDMMLLELLFSDLSDAPIANGGNGHPHDRTGNRPLPPPWIDGRPHRLSSRRETVSLSSVSTLPEAMEDNSVTY